MNQKIKTGGNLVRVAKIDGKKMQKMWKKDEKYVTIHSHDKTIMQLK